MAENNQKETYDVIDYLEKIKEIETRFSDDNSIVVFRGEPVDYPTFGMPGIFRGDYLKNDSFFERNLLEELKANRLTNGNTYLEIAIDSQHGGFPSRLLDVSYNCLVALYFAVVSVPERKEEEDEKDGRVLVYKVNKAYCPKGRNVIDNYDSILNNPSGILNSEVFSINHKLIDHIKLNNRIIAQQGALISFQGLEWEPIPDYMCEGIIIPHDKKGPIAEQLEKFFGINTSFIYPEIEHAVEKYKTRATSIESKEYTLENEIQMTISNMKKIIDYNLQQLKFIEDNQVQLDVIMNTEEKLLAYKRGVENFCYKIDEYCSDSDNNTAEYMKYKNSILRAYSEVIRYYESNPYIHYLQSEIELCIDYLKVDMEEIA